MTRSEPKTMDLKSLVFVQKFSQNMEFYFQLKGANIGQRLLQETYS